MNKEIISIIIKIIIILNERTVEVLYLVCVPSTCTMHRCATCFDPAEPGVIIDMLETAFTDVPEWLLGTPT